MACTLSSSFIVEKPRACYLESGVIRGLDERVRSALEELRSCCACPRNCKVNRLENEAKVCHTGRYARVA